MELTICSPKSIINKCDFSINKNIKIRDNIKEINLSEINFRQLFISMNDENNLKNLLKPYSVNSKLMDKTPLNCVLPSKVGLELARIRALNL